MITLTQRLLASAVVSSSVDGDYFTITITKANHGISINTSAKINITGLDFYTANLANGTKAQDFYNGDKIFIATTTDNLVYKIQLRTFPAVLGVISGTPVVNIVNSSWEIESGRYLFQVATGGNVNWNGNKIKIYAEFNNQELSPITLYPENTSLATNEISINGRILTFEGQIDKVYIALNNIDNITNIPLLITKL
jgi:hypothetical protein